MKKLILIIITLSYVSLISAQQKQTNNQSKIESALIKIDSLIKINTAWIESIELDLSLKQRYKLYQTENIYNFLLLDTKTGQIKQVQWSLESNKEGAVTINDEVLTYGHGYGSGSFELYPTKNMYQFILLDKTDGRRWHVQWGMDTTDRWIRRIY